MNYMQCKNKIDLLSNKIFDEYSNNIYIIIYKINELSYIYYDKNSFIEIIDNSKNFDKFSNLYRNRNNNIYFTINKDLNIFESHNLFYAIRQNHNKKFLLYELIPINNYFIDFDDEQKHQYIKQKLEYYKKYY